MSEERHVSCIEASDSPCTPETCEETICWVCEEPDPSWPCPSRRAQDAEAAIARVRDVCEQWQNYDAVDRATAPYLLVTDKLTAAKQILQALDCAS